MKSIGGKGVLALSLILGIGTSYLVYQYVSEAADQRVKPVETARVLTAAVDIAPRTTITPQMLRVVDVPVTLKVPQAMASPADASGKVTKLPISQGEQLLGSKLFGDREESGLAFVIPPGKRAVSVAVNEVLGSGGMIVPGDFVDVVGVIDTKPSDSVPQFGLSAPTPTKGDITAMAQYVLQNVEVLAVAQQLEGDPPPASTQDRALDGIAPNRAQSQPVKQQPQAQPSARTATLAVSPQEAERLVLAEDKARIRLVLRARGDDSLLQLDSGLFGDLRGAATLRNQPQ